MPDSTGTNMTYTVHPLRHDLARGMVVLLIIVLVAWGAAVTTGMALLGAVALLILLASVASYLLPTTYDLSADGITVRNRLGRRHRSWHEFRRWRESGDAVVLLTRRRNSRLDHYRGLTIPWGPDRVALRAFLHARLADAPERPSESP